MFEIEQYQQDIAELKYHVHELNEQIATLRDHLKQSRDFDYQDLINGLLHDIKVRDQQLLTAGRENKELEGKNKRIQKELDAAIGELLDANPI